MKLFSLCILSVLLCTTLYCQKNSYRFAATYFGVESELSLQNNSFSFINNEGQLQTEQLSSTVTPRLVIGGTHFWNRADFYISLDMGSIRIDGSNKAKVRNGVLTGFRIIPFQLKENRVSPFLGSGFNSKGYQQEGANGESQLYTNWQWFFEAGLNYLFKSNKLIGIEARYFPRNSYRALYNRTDYNSIKVSPYSFSVSYKVLFDFSAGYSSKRSKQFFSKMKNELTTQNKLNTFSFGIGMSAFIPFEKTEHAARKEFFNDEIDADLFPEIGLEYFHHHHNASLRITYRPIIQQETAYRYEYSLRNHSVALEGFKFIGNYYGFIPFVGPFVSQNYYRLKEKDNGQKLTDFSQTKIGYGLVFGWDIRFTETDHIILRTNMRYIPNYKFQKDNLKYTVKGLEFNFIQLVYYPERHKTLRKLNQK